MSTTTQQTDDPRSVLIEEQTQEVINRRMGGMVVWYWDETYKWEQRAWLIQVSALVTAFLATTLQRSLFPVRGLSGAWYSHQRLQPCRRAC
jgi:hypothetical protein